MDGIPYFVTGAGGRSLYGFGPALPETQARYNAEIDSTTYDGPLPTPTPHNFIPPQTS